MKISIEHICPTCGTKFICNTEIGYCRGTELYTCACRTCCAISLKLKYDQYINPEFPHPCFKDIQQKLVSKVVYEALLVERFL